MRAIYRGGPSKKDLLFSGWPQGKKVAVMPVINVEVFLPGTKPQQQQQQQKSLS